MAGSAIAQLSRPRPGGTTTTTQENAAACLARRPAVGRRGVGRIRLGYARTGLSRGVPIAPVRRTRDIFRYCAGLGSGHVTAVFSSRSPAGRVELVLSTAPSAAIRRAYPERRRIGPGLFRASPTGRRPLGVSRGWVRFVAVASDRPMRDPRRRCYLD